MPEAYRAPRWLPGGHAQTLYAALLAPRRGPFCIRERWPAPDGDFVDVDRIAGTPGSPLVVLFHGLEGGSRSHYAQSIMADLARRGWGGAVPHFRGCSGEPNRLPRAYHSGDTEEIDWLLRRFRLQAGAAPLFAVGVSLGGNVLLKWLGESGRKARLVLAAAAAVSAPLDLTAAGEALTRGFNHLYTQVFLSTLKPKTIAKLDRFPGLFDPGAVLSARSLREFDDAYTAPQHGFRDSDDYYLRASSKPWLGAIAIPTLLLNARNDPFVPESALPAAENVSSCVECDFPRQGGHAGFVTGIFPGNLEWLPRRLAGFFVRSMIASGGTVGSLDSGFVAPDSR